MSQHDDPLILTAAFDPASASAFQSLRDRHFPPRLNIVPAHLTLFHHLPGPAIDAIRTELQAIGSGQAAMAFTTAGLRFLGRGVAIEIDAAGLPALRGQLAAHWKDWLTAQDAQGFRPHVTVQNKADPAVARALRDDLATSLQPIQGLIVGLDLWHYRGGPWDHAGRYGFDNAA